MSFLPHQSTPQNAAFTCNTCGVRFVVADLQRQHMKTDWHRYNLKRRVALLPSIALDVFAEKVLAQQKQTQEDDSNDEFGFPERRRVSRGVRQLTKKDLKMMARYEAVRGRASDLGSGVTRESSPAVSVASELSAFSLGDSEHLSEAESFETGSELNYSDVSEDSWAGSESEGDSDVESIESGDLGNVSLPNWMCFYCGKNNSEVENNVRHMSHVHGLYIPERTYLVDLDGLLTFLNEVITLDHDCLVCGFHGKSLESIRLHVASKGHCKLPYESAEEKLVFAEFYDFTEDEPAKKSSLAKKVSFAATDDELTLPSGSKVCHRSLVRASKPNVVAREAPDSCKTVALVDRRFSPGLNNYLVARQERETQRLVTRAGNRYERKMKLKKANYQPHFRDEILGT